MHLIKQICRGKIVKEASHENLLLGSIKKNKRVYLSGSRGASDKGQIIALLLYFNG